MECPYVEIAEKLEKISRNDKAWITRKLDIRGNTFVGQSAHKIATYDIYEEMSQMRTELRLVLKHVTWGIEKVNAVNYVSKPPLPTDEYQ